jgi:predicted RNase H-like HicB family nuclease
MHIVALIQEQHGTYTASFPDFPNCAVVAHNPDAVMAKASEALSKHIANIISEGHELPPVRSLSRLVKDPVFVADSMGLMIALVPYTPSTQELRLTITMEELLVTQIDWAAKNVGESRSGYIANAARQRLARDANPTVDSIQPALDSTICSVSAPEVVGTAYDSPTDTATSLACIKEILDRLDADSVGQDSRQSTAKILEPTQRLLVKPAR